MSSPIRLPLPGSDGRFKDKHLPERLGQSQLDAQYKFSEDSSRPGLFFLAGSAPADGALAQASASYKTAAKAAGTSRLKLLALMDSTGDGFGNPGGPDSWSKVWPLKLAELLRTHLGRPAGGRGWVPVSNPLSPSSYVWRPSTLLPNTATATDPLGSQIGIPGSLWLQRGHATNVDEVQWTLSAGVTSVDVVHTGYGASDNGLVITAANTGASITKNSIGDRVVTRITNPGATIDIHGAAGVGVAALGIVEYVGDENAGVTMWNLSQGSMAAHEYAAWMTNSAYSLKPMIGTYAPHVALVCLGANDYSRARTTTQLTTALETIRSNIVAVSPNTVVVFVLRPVDPTMTTEQTPTATWAQFCTAVQSYAAGVGAAVLDLRTSVPASGGGLYLGDKVHWTEAGQNAAAAAALDYMKVGA
ncbi:SGNH/GDSL hydrolase family protein [Rhodococcoides fascians]|uniref:SGNH/GDSL hydrolase family protein n=1 Tax=Rhodococcoides fascians TaxID=1828 RepID=UPI00050C448A|nr:SGNH/GDSL hydrolase family protein [Rhodococcus fascians]